MPNWVQHTLTFDAQTDYDTFVDKYTDDNGDMDFNRIIPMPKSLQVGNDPFCHSKAILMVREMINRGNTREQCIEGIKPYITSSEYHIYAQLSGIDTDKPEIVNTEAENLYKKALDDKQYDAGDTIPPYLDNFTKYGVTSWYGWSIKNWGTKWNAADTTLHPENNRIIFETAWSVVAELLLKAHSDTGNIPFTLYYIDEGGPEGRCAFKDGTITDVEELI